MGKLIDGVREINMEEFALKYKIIKQTKEGTYIVEEIEEGK